MMTIPKRRGAEGFTFIEIMIVVVLIAVVASIALPSYTATVVKGRRTDCMGTMMGFAQAMERYFAINYTYEGAANGGADTGAPDSDLFVNQCPTEGSATYNLTINAADGDSYTVRATPVAGTSQDGNGILEVNSLGQRFWDQNGDGDTTDAGENNWKSGS